MNNWSRVTFIAAIAVVVTLSFERAEAQTLQGLANGCGSNMNAQLGNGTISETGSPLPVAVTGLGTVTSIVAGVGHSMALKEDGTIWAWGANYNGQLGAGIPDRYSTVPVQVSGLTNVVRIAAGGDQSFAVKADGTLWVWGQNAWGQLGIGSSVPSSFVPVQVSSLSNIVAAAGGMFHSIALKSDGSVWAWGHNSWGQLGNGTNTHANAPVQVSGLANVLSIAAGSFHNMAVRADGTVWAWGHNLYGQLGIGSALHSYVPVQVPGLGDVARLAPAGLHTLALKTDGTVWAWGTNMHGQLGTGNNMDSNVPIAVSSLTNVLSVVSGYFHSMALKSDGTVWSWGGNYDGQLCNGTTIPSNLPGAVPSLNGALALFTDSNAAHGFALFSPPPAGVEFASAFPKLTIKAGPPAGFDLNELFTLGAASNGIDPLTEPAELRIGTYSVIIPAGSFKAIPNGRYAFNGVINNVSLAVQIEPVSYNTFSFKVGATGVNLSSLTNPVEVLLIIGNDQGAASAIAKFQ